MIQALSNVEVITLFVEDLQAAKAFYLDVLHVSEAHALVEPAPVATRDAGARLMLTIAVEDANAVCGELRRHGVELLSGPIDRSWGRRTAAFADPAGNAWEIAQVLPP
jgi:lactoylglutathione lyase